MDVLPSGGIFRELQVVHDTGYFSGQASLEDDWHQVGDERGQQQPRYWEIEVLVGSGKTLVLGENRKNLIYL